MLVKYLFVLLMSLKVLYTQEIQTVEVIMGHTAELPCNVSASLEGVKLDVVIWYRNGSSAALISHDLREGVENTARSADGRYQLVAAEDEGLYKLHILSTRPIDAGPYHCLADFASHRGQKTYVELVVIEPPKHLYVVHENGTGIVNTSAGVNTSRDIGPYYIGDTVHLFCVALGGKPRPTLSWWTDDRQLKQNSTPLSTVRVRSELVFGPLTREDHGRVLSCLATNTDKIPSLSIDITLDMYLPPELVSVRLSSGSATSARVRAGESLGLQCRVLGARPPPPVQWSIDESQLFNLEQNITMEPSQRRVVSEVELVVGAQHDETMITCCAPEYRRSTPSLVCARPLPLIVIYPPILEIYVEGELHNTTLEVMKGSNIALNCTYKANPPIYQLIWFHQDDIINREAKDRDDILQPVLELQNVSEGDAGEYVCAATNDEGSRYSEPLIIDVTFPAYCEDNSTSEYGLAENEAVNITCNVKGNPEPTSFHWVIVNAAVNVTDLRTSLPHTTVETDDRVLMYIRPNNTEFNTIFCWGYNDIVEKTLPQTPCKFLITDETAPRPPSDCKAVKSASRDITITCQKGHDGGLTQKFTFTVKMDSGDEIMSIISLEPMFIIQEPKQDSYKFNIMAFNAKGESDVIVIDSENIVDETADVPQVISAVSDITTLALSLAGGVALVALAACGLVLCARDRADGPRPRAASEPPLCAYTTEESNCETCHDSDDSDCNVRRTDSFRRAMAKYPSQNYDVRRTSSFHSARYLDFADQEAVSKCNEGLRHSASCRRSLQNISRKREMDILCNHLATQIPPEVSYHTPRPMNTFCTMPRKTRQKPGREISDETSEITQISDGFSLPPPPDEFSTYRAGVRIRDIPQKSVASYATVTRKNSTGKDPIKYNNVKSPISTTGLPSISGPHNSLYTYPDDDHHGQAKTNPFDDSS